MGDEPPDIQRIFLREAFDQLESLESQLLEVERTGDSAVITSLLRVAHNLKGASATAGQPELADFVHLFESVLDGLRGKRIEATPTVYSQLLEAIDAIRTAVTGLAKTGTLAATGWVEVEAELTALVARPSPTPAVTTSGTAPAGAPAGRSSGTTRGRESAGQTPVQESAGQAPEATKAAKAGACESAGETRGATEAAKAAASRPAVAASGGPLHAEDEPGPAAAVAVEDSFSLSEYDRIRLGVLRRQGKRLERVESQQDPSGPTPAASVRVLRRAGVVVALSPAESVLAEAGPGTAFQALLATALPEAELTSILAEARLRVAGADAIKPAEVAPAATATTAASAGLDTIKVDVRRVDRLLEMIGELVIVESMVSNAPELARVASRQLVSSLHLLTTISLELQDAAMSMRMVPVRGVFRKMERLVRDLAHRTGKELQLVCHGETTEVDRGIVERLADPLMHLIRNAADHGVERREARLQAGKPAVGTIRLSAAHQAGNIVVEVSDDGVGIDREAVRARANELGMVSAETRLSDAETLALIFSSKLTTAREVTDLSGRGVGLDVVRRNVEELRGRISVSSTPGEGTSFRLTLPLTLAIINGTLVACGDEQYMIPTLSIVECLQPEAGDFHRQVGRVELLKVRDELLPVLHLDRLLGVRRSQGVPHQQLVVVVESVGSRVGLVVDDVVRQQQVVIKSLDMPTVSVPYCAGAAILSDGRVGLILSVDELARLSSRKDAAQAKAPMGSATSAVAGTVGGE